MKETEHKTTYHYNQDVNFFRSFLDPYMKYTSGLFVNGHENLESGIRNMLQTIHEQARLPDNAKILDIGPGWGALLNYLIEQRGEGSFEYLGISPSRVQNRYIQRKTHFSFPLETKSFEDWSQNGHENTFDAVFSIGSFCHLSDKATQMARMNDILRPAGRLIIEDTFFISNKLYQNHKAQRATHFVQTDVFGYSHITSLSQFIEDAHSVGFQVKYILEHSSSYKRTLDLWIENLRRLDNREFPLRNDFIKAFRIAKKGFGRTIGNYLLVLERSDIYE